MASCRLAPSTGSEFWSPMITNALPVESAALAARRRGCSRRAPIQIVAPEADLVVIAQAVAILRSVERRRRRVARQQVQRLPADAHRNIPVTLRATAAAPRVPRGEYQSKGSGVSGLSGSSAPGMSRHRNLRKVRTCSRSIGNRDSSAMAYWPGNSPKPSASAPPPILPVVVEIEAGRHAGVRLGAKKECANAIGAAPFCGRAR